MKKYFCIFGGGGIRGVAYAGALRSLVEQDIQIVGLAGSSVGAVFSSLYVAGYSCDELEDIFINLKMDIFKDINFNFGKDFALSKGDAFYAWIRDLIESKFYGENYEKGKMEPVKFKDIEHNYIVLSTNLTDSTYKEFSKHTTPDAEVAHAVRASVSMPGLFRPVYQDGEIIVDGDLMKSWPLWRLSPSLCPPDARIMEFRLEDLQQNKLIDNSLAYLNAVYNTISSFATDFIIDLYKERDKFDYIKINSPDISVLDFAINQNKKRELIDIGYEATSSYFKYFLPQKRKKLLDNYYEIFLILQKIRHELRESSDIKSAYAILCELFMHLCEYKRYIDLDIYEKIDAFKNLFKRNYKISKFFFISGYTLNDKTLVLIELQKIMEIIDSKTAELRDN